MLLISKVMKELTKSMKQILTTYYASQLKKDQWKDFEELKKERFKKLKAIIKHAYNYVPYYHRLLSSANIKPDDIKNHEDIRKIPPVSRRDIQKDHQDFIVKGIEELNLPSHFTSGSTGIPLKIIEDYSLVHVSHAGALGLYTFLECGAKLSDKFVLISGRAHSMTRSREYVRLLGNIPIVTIPWIPHERLNNILRQLNPDVIWIYPSVLFQLANYDVSGISPRLIITQGEMVTPDLRVLVEKMFGSEFFETYGSVEFGHLAFECDEHYGLHILTNGAFIEFVDEDGEYVSSGEQGEIIVTGLWNYTMPLIRYRIEDLGIPTDEKCPCGRSWPLIKDIQGRKSDLIILPSGMKIGLAPFYRYIYEEFEKNVFSISQYQIIQDRKDRIIFKVVKGREFDHKVLERIKNNLELHFARMGENLDIATQVVKEIPAERSGKRRILISKPNQRLSK